MTHAWAPKSILLLRTYTVEAFVADLLAGVTVGLVALPLAMAFAISSGVAPQAGIYCAIVTGFLVSALGGSRFQIGGPTGAFVVVVASIVATYGIDGLFMCTMMAGVLLVVLGATGLGAAVKFIPRPVVVGFTNGIAVLIASTQIKDFLGLTVDRLPGDFAGRMRALVAHLDTASLVAIAMASTAVVTIALTRRFAPRISGSVLVLVLGTALAWALHLPVATVGTLFGGVPGGLPHFQIPVLRLDLVPGLLPSVLTITMLGAIESLMSAVVADRMSGDRHNPNVELIAQGIANVASPMFGGLPATGAIARTATNVKNGGRTPIAGLVHALTLLLIMLCFGRWAALIPLPSLAGILLIVAYHMSEWRHFARLFRSPPGDILILLNTFLLTVLIDLTVAIETGMILAAFLLMRRVAGLSQVGYVTDLLQEQEEGEDAEAVSRRRVPSGVEVFEVYGTFFFGAVSKFKDALRRVERAPKVLILRLREVHAIDATGLRVIEDLVDKNWRTGTALIVSGAQAQPMEALTRSGLVTRIGERNFQQTLDDALVRAREILDRLAASARESG